MKLNREELANTSFDQINFNEWRLWFFKEFVKILRRELPSEMTLVTLRRQTSWHSVTGNSPQPKRVRERKRKRNRVNSRDSYFDEDLVFPIELQSYYI